MWELLPKPLAPSRVIWQSHYAEMYFRAYVVADQLWVAYCGHEDGKFVSGIGKVGHGG
jgi:hypothetical protein